VQEKRWVHYHNRVILTLERNTSQLPTFALSLLGRSNGEAYVQLDNPQSAKDALESLNRKHMGKRYIECVHSPLVLTRQVG
jgi:RNA recognition motif-containing protein